MRYDYSLDIGQSIKSEEELKEQEKQQASQENTPSSGEELSAKRIEEELKQEAEKEAAEKHEEQPAEEKNEDNSAEYKEDVTVKEISFEKAELIEEHKKAQEIIESLEKEKPEEDDAYEDSEDKPKDELEEDVNEIIEDSFKEPQEYINTKKNDVKEYVPEHKNYAIPIALALILLGAIVFGFVYFMHPGGTTPAAAIDIPAEETALEPIAEEEPEITEPEALLVAPEKRAVAENKTLPANESSSAVEAIKTPAGKQTSKSEEQALNDILLAGLKD